MENSTLPEIQGLEETTSRVKVDKDYDLCSWLTANAWLMWAWVAGAENHAASLILFFFLTFSGVTLWAQHNPVIMADRSPKMKNPEEKLPF